ncbi:MAG: hypothetical protein E7116_06080 [Bacteroidales bacterium]|nr:hypothetical protein [Bacteroidales bacterium]
MKRLLFAFMAAFLLFSACKKDDSATDYQFEGCQWITEEEEAYGDYPAYKTLFDVGLKSGAGKFTMAMLMLEDMGPFHEGDLVLVSQGSYTYDKSKKEFSDESGTATIKFLSKNMIKLSFDGVDMVFTKVDKPYSLSDLIDPEELFKPEDFEVVPSKDSDWAGGSITFTANRTIQSLTYDVLTDGVTEQDICKTTLTGETLVLGQYVGAGSALADCKIQIKAADEEGNETTCIVTSRAWRPAVYTEYKGEYTQDHLDNGWSRGQECWLGALCADGELPYDGETDSFGGISYTVPDFMEPFGSRDNKIGYDTPNDSVSGTITYSYGALSFELIIDIDR